MNKLMFFILFCFIALRSYSQNDSSFISFHSQATSISQYHPPFNSPYSGQNSLISHEGIASSLTNTLFFALRPWKSGMLIINPEVAGGVGFSGTTGIAGFPNGEIFRVGNPKPTIYLARLIFEEKISLSKRDLQYYADDINTVRGLYPNNFIKFFIGRFCLADYFDGNPYNHDPRRQFMNWSFMSAGAWDYAADTRGYTWGGGMEFRKNNWRSALVFAQEPAIANALELDSHIAKAFASQIEVTKFYTLGVNPGQIQLTVFFNKAHMGNYNESIDSNSYNPDITSTADYKHHKWGFVLNGAQQINKNWGTYARFSWNDGKNETWAFTEIDQSLNFGFQWSKDTTEEKNNVLGCGIVLNGISPEHRNYLAAGGYGFIIGDGKLHYKKEIITEIYYRFCFFNNRLQVSPDYQFVVNPAYNGDRGPVHIFSLRTHIQL